MMLVLDERCTEYLNAHGTSTPVGDLNEVKAIKNTFGEAAKHLKVSYNKINDWSLTWCNRWN